MFLIQMYGVNAAQPHQNERKHSSETVKNIQIKLCLFDKVCVDWMTAIIWWSDHLMSWEENHNIDSQCTQTVINTLNDRKSYVNAEMHLNPSVGKQIITVVLTA